MKKVTFLLVTFGFLLFPLVASAELDATTSTYTLSMSKKKAQEKLESGIEAAVDDMNFITRPIARSRLKSTNEVYDSLGFKKDGDKISIQYNKLPFITKVNGKPEKWKRDDGEVFTVTHKLNGNVLTQKFVAEDGVKIITYVFSKDYSKVNVTVKLESPKLAAPMTYMLTYKKK